MVKLEIEQKADLLVRQANFVKPPVQVRPIANLLGIEVQPAKLGTDVSGLLVIKNNVAVIGYNDTHPRARQRFTVAHEIGHFDCHRHHSELFIDKGDVSFYRDSQSSTREIKREKEANWFAAALLMPEWMIDQVIEENGFDLMDERQIILLAKKFIVSQSAMTYRLMNLQRILTPL